MSDVKWIKITTNIFDDEKIAVIEELPDQDTIIVIWFKLLALAGKKNDSGLIYITRDIPYDPDKLARVLRREKKHIVMALDIFASLEMIHFEDDKIAISNWDKHQNVDGLLKIREQNRLRVAKFREKQKLVASNVDVTLRNATDKNRIDKKRKEKNIKEYTDEFIVLWANYPNQKDKRDCFNKYLSTLKKGATHIELATAVNNYSNTVVGKDVDFIKRGKTFFGPSEVWREYLSKKTVGKFYKGDDNNNGPIGGNYFGNENDEGLDDGVE